MSLNSPTFLLNLAQQNLLAVIFYKQYWIRRVHGHLNKSTKPRMHLGSMIVNVKFL